MRNHAHRCGHPNGCAEYWHVYRCSCLDWLRIDYRRHIRSFTVSTRWNRSKRAAVMLIIDVSGTARITELAFPTHRAPITSLYNTTWYLGSIVAAWATFGTFSITTSWSWRIPSVLQGLPSAIQFCFIFFIPESPRWLGKWLISVSVC